MKRSGSKLLCILLLLSLLLSLTACGKPETQLEKTAGYLRLQIASRFFKLRFRFAAGGQGEQQRKQEQNTK